MGDLIGSVTPDQWQKLLFCILIDLGGDASYLLPFLGEIGDGVYAPVEALLLNRLFGSNFISLIGLVEEGLPFTDWFPTATFAWVVETFFPNSQVAKVLGLNGK